MSNSSPERRLREEPVELAELLDRLLDTGVVLRGKVLIRVAEIDLIYLDLSLVLCSIDRALQLDHQAVVTRAALLDVDAGTKAQPAAASPTRRLH